MTNCDARLEWFGYYIVPTCIAYCVIGWMAWEVIQSFGL